MRCIPPPTLGIELPVLDARDERFPFVSGEENGVLGRIVAVANRGDAVLLGDFDAVVDARFGKGALAELPITKARRTSLFDS